MEDRSRRAAVRLPGAGLDGEVALRDRTQFLGFFLAGPRSCPAQAVAAERTGERPGNYTDAPVAKLVEMIHCLIRGFGIVDVNAGHAEVSDLRSLTAASGFVSLEMRYLIEIRIIGIQHQVFSDGESRY